MYYLCLQSSVMKLYVVKSHFFFFVNKKSLQAQHDIKYVSVLVLNLRMSFFTATYSKHVSRFRRRDTNLRGCIKSVGYVYPSCSVYTHDQLNNIYDGVLSTTRAQYRFYLVIKEKKRLNSINKEIFFISFYNDSAFSYFNKILL